MSEPRISTLERVKAHGVAAVRSVMRALRMAYHVYEETVWRLMWVAVAGTGLWVLIWMNWHVPDDGSIYLLPLYVLQALRAELHALNGY